MGFILYTRAPITRCEAYRPPPSKNREIGPFDALRIPLKSCAFALVLAFFSAAASAQNLWQPLSSGDSRGLETLTDSALNSHSSATAIAIRFDKERLDSIAENDSIDVEIDEVLHRYNVERVNRFINGDWGILAFLDDGNRRHALTLTRSSEQLLGSVNTAVDNYLIEGIRKNQTYLGWLSLENREGPFKPVDEPRLTTSSNIQAQTLVASDIDLTLFVGTTNPVKGEELVVTVTISNKLDTELEEETVSFHEFFINNTLISTDGDCQLRLKGTGVFRNQLDCKIPAIPARGSYQFKLHVLPVEAAGERVRLVALIDGVITNVSFVLQDDIFLDSDGDLIGDFNERIVGTDPLDAGSTIPYTDPARIDVLVYYTAKFRDDIAPISPAVKINQLFADTNAMFAASGAYIEVMPVATKLTSLEFDDNIKGAFSKFRRSAGDRPEFPDIAAERSIYGADQLLLLDGLHGDDEFCGIAEGTRNYTNGILSTNEYYKNIYLASYLPGSGCHSITLAHEFGHNLGLGHSRYDPSLDVGTFTWSRGHGVNDSFNTIMSYNEHFPGSKKLPLFSSPTLNACEDQPCGVSRDNPIQGADAVATLNLTRFQVANFRLPRPNLALQSLSGSVPSSTLLGGAAVTTDESYDEDPNYNSAFKHTDEISVVGTFHIAEEHIGKMGNTVVVISADNQGLFQMLPSGDYQRWDGSLETLGGNGPLRPLQATEELAAFKRDWMGRFGIFATYVTVYFGYSLEESGDLIYSQDGIRYYVI